MDISVAKRILRLREKNGSLVVGINGIDGAGKTTLAENLFKELRSKNVTTRVIHVDDYNNLDIQSCIYDSYQRSQLDSDIAFGAQELYNYYLNSIDYQQLKLAIRGESSSVSVLIVEGVFLFKSELVDDIDLKIFIDIPPELARLRFERRKAQINDPRPVTVFDDIWLPSFERYRKENEPGSLADIVIKDTD